MIEKRSLKARIRLKDKIIAELLADNDNFRRRLDVAKEELDKLKSFNPMYLEKLLTWRMGVAYSFEE